SRKSRRRPRAWPTSDDVWPLRARSSSIRVTPPTWTVTMRVLLPRSTAVALFAAFLPAATCLAQSDSTERSALGAGLLSYLFPGAGSFYAGNDRHALVHAGIATASAAALASTFYDRCPGGRCSVSTQVRGWGGLLVYGTNYVWSIVTAVRDAN